MKRRKIGVFTIASKNYLAYVRVLMASVARVHPEYRLFLCLADTKDSAFAAATECFETVESRDLGIRHFEDMALRYDIMEFNTAIKPFMFDWLLRNTDLDSIIYLDPDIRAYSRFESLESVLATDTSVVLTPHITKPVEDGKNPNDYHMLQAGVFNLGFAAINRSRGAQDFVSWWGRRLETAAHADFSRNLFTDQRWCDLAPCFVDRLHILKSPAYNVAYWNLSERSLARRGSEWLVNDQPLAFFHFSGVNASKENLISKHQNRFTWDDLPHLKPLFDAYRESLVEAGWETTRSWPYAYATTAQGLKLTPMMRAAYANAFPEPRTFSESTATATVLAACNGPTTVASNDQEPPITVLMEAIYRQRPDLQAAFNLGTSDGRSAFRSWFASAGPREYGLPMEVVPSTQVAVTPTDEVPSAPSTEPPEDSPVSRTAPAPDLGVKAASTWALLPRSVQRRLAPMLANRLQAPAAGRAKQVAANGPAVAVVADARGLRPTERIDALDQPAAMQQWLDDRFISVLMRMIWASRADLQAAFDLASREGQEAFLGWYAASAEREYGLRPGDQSIKPVETPAQMGRPGANLIGYAHAELGMGEHVRMSAAALQQTGVSYGVVNFNVGVASRQGAALEHGELVNDNPFAANIFHINADQMLIAYCKLGRDFFRGRYNIGYWAWELAKCPAEWLPVMQMVDEIWAPSRFIQNAFAEVTDIPVIYMPLCVTLPQFQPLPRGHFGLPERAFAFLYTFDFFSFLDRKNPFAAIAAFQKAFPRSQRDVCLVLKVMNGNTDSPLWRQMEQLIDGDARIFVINRTLNRAELLALFETSNCFVSLHRSEGFGRGPAEAMYLGKPVIATNYSGNTDFTLADNSCLVDYRLVPVEAGQYPLHQGQVWADADIDNAAWHMRRLRDDAAFANDIGLRGQRFVRENFSQRAIGTLYARRLKNLGLT